MSTLLSLRCEVVIVIRDSFSSPKESSGPWTDSSRVDGPEDPKGVPLLVRGLLVHLDSLLFPHFSLSSGKGPEGKSPPERSGSPQSSWEEL